MFTKIFKDIGRGESIAPDHLRRMFDLAMTKKLGVVKLPPSFWMQDAKINPRSDHLLWVALLLEDRERLALAFSALAVEHEEFQRKRAAAERESLAEVFNRLLQELLDLLPEENLQQRKRIQQLGQGVV